MLDVHCSSSTMLDPSAKVAQQLSALRELVDYEWTAVEAWCKLGIKWKNQTELSQIIGITRSIVFALQDIHSPSVDSLSM